MFGKAKINMEDIEFKSNFNGVKATVQAALARVLFMIELDKKINNKGITCNAFHPGFVKSNLP